MKRKNVFTLNIFIGFQNKSDFHLKKRFYNLGNALKHTLKSGNLKINLNLKYGEFPPGANLWNEVLESINSSDICIFDISENNPNVLLEVGIGLGSHKLLILLKNELSMKKFKTPTDLNSLIYIPYKSDVDFTQKKFLGLLKKSILRYIRESHESIFYYHSLWGLKPTSKTIIIPSILPGTEKPIEFENYVQFRKYGDLDALTVITETLHRLYPKMDIEIFPAKEIKELPADWESSNLIFIGGPDFNPLVNTFEFLCPLKYHYGDDDSVSLIEKNSKIRYTSKFKEDSNNSTAEDYGFFLKRCQKRNGHSKIIMIGGSYTWGVYGSAKLFSCNRISTTSDGYINSKKVVSLLGTDPHFLIIIKVKGNTGGIISLGFKKSDIIPYHK